LYLRLSTNNLECILECTYHCTEIINDFILVIKSIIHFTFDIACDVVEFFYSLGMEIMS